MPLVSKKRVDAELANLFALVDRDGDEMITYDEFSMLVQGAREHGKRRPLDEENMHDEFVACGDLGGEGVITLDEWTRYFAEMGRQHSEIKPMYEMEMKEFEEDMKRLRWVCKVTIEIHHHDKEYEGRVAAKKKYVNEELRKIFSHLDADHSGDVTKKEFDMLVEGPRTSLHDTPVSREKLTKAYKSMDANGDGVVDEGEFLIYFGNYFYGGLYNMSKNEADQYITFFKAVATLQTGITPEQANEHLMDEMMISNQEQEKKYGWKC